MAAVARTEPRRRRTDPTTWTAVRARSADWWLRRGQSPRRLGILAIIPACRDMQRPSKCMTAWRYEYCSSSHYSTKFRDPRCMQLSVDDRYLLISTSRYVRPYSMDRQIYGRGSLKYTKLSKNYLSKRLWSRRRVCAYGGRDKYSYFILNFHRCCIFILSRMCRIACMHAAGASEVQISCTCKILHVIIFLSH